jgi:hypothetical protein
MVNSTAYQSLHHISISGVRHRRVSNKSGIVSLLVFGSQMAIYTVNQVDIATAMILPVLWSRKLCTLFFAASRAAKMLMSCTPNRERPALLRQEQRAHVTSPCP